MIHSRELTYTLHKLVFLMDKMGDHVLQNRLSITFSQFRMLMAIDHKKNRSQHDIAEFWDMTEPAVSRQIEILIEKKMVLRRENDKNRREHLLTLTDRGEEDLQKGLKLLDSEYNALYVVISADEQKTLAANLDQLLQAICKIKDSFCR